MNKTNKKKKHIRVGMVCFSYYPEDVRPRRECEALTEEGMSVDMICLKKPGEPSTEVVNGVTAYRLPVRRRRGSMGRYIFEYALFFLLSFFKLTLLYIRKRYQIVQIHNMPDFLVFAALIPKLFGARIILDLHDPMPEVFVSKYANGHLSRTIRLLRTIEKWSVRFANVILTPNIAFRDIFASRSCGEDKIHIVMNSPQEDIFEKYADPIPGDPASRGTFKLMFHGTVVERHGLDIALGAIDRIRPQIPGIEFNVFGQGDYVETFLDIVAERGLQDVVNYHGQVQLEQIVRNISSNDVGLIPNKLSTFTNLNFPTRIFEFICMKKPVIVPRTRGILDYFDEDSLFFFEAGDADSLAERILDIYTNRDRSREVLDKGYAVYNRYRWELQSKQYVDLVSSLCEK